MNKTTPTPPDMPDESAHAVVADYLCGEIRNLAAEMKRVAVLLDAAGYQNKYIEMSDAATLALEWVDGIMGDVQENLPFHDMDRLHALMHERKKTAINQTARNAVDVIEDIYSMEIAEPDCWQAIREGLGMTKERAKL